jgi:hypothetical protein
MDALYRKAKKYGANDFGFSDKKDKRFFVIYDHDKKINFGSRYGKAYIDHHDDQKRKAWYARHSKIKNKYDNIVIDDPYSASFWSARILW